MNRIIGLLLVTIAGTVAGYSFASAEDGTAPKARKDPTADTIAKQWQPPNTGDVHILTSGDNLAYMRLSAKSPLGEVCKFYATKCGYKGDIDFSTTASTRLDSKSNHIIISSEIHNSILFIHSSADATITIRIPKQDGEFTKDVLVTVGTHK